jgi:diguanylate cyclase (GGDEF)-like protein
MRNPGSPLVYLTLLQVMVLVLYGVHVQLFPTTPLKIGLVSSVAVLTLMVLTIPRAHLAMPWFIGLLTLGDAAALFATVSPSSSTEPWILCTVMLLLALASYVTTLVHFGLLSTLVIVGYAMMLHQSALLQTSAVFVLPSLLCLTLVFLSKISLTQAELKRMSDTEERTRSKSMSDALTGLPNRAQFLEQVARSVQCGQHNRDFHFAVLFVDLDGFKPINDRLGHKAGDAVLRQAAKLFQGCLRKGDLVGRYGGDEFTFLINNVTGPADAIRAAERILVKIQAPIDVGEPVKVGASIGIALSTNMHERAEELIRDADSAMYRAKAQGKNCYVLSDQASDIPKAELKERWKRMVQLKW